jgi:hypothetical protein
MLDITRRNSDFFPHHSYVIRNVGDTVTIKLNNKNKMECHQELGSVLFPNPANYPITLSGNLEEHVLKSGEAIVMIFTGGLVPPEGLDKSLLLKAVKKPGLWVDKINVHVGLECSVPGSLYQFTLASNFTQQLACHDCKFEFHVSVLKDPVDVRRCCPEHSPMYEQNIFMYYPHIVPRVGSDGTASCDCCI